VLQFWEEPEVDMHNPLPKILWLFAASVAYSVVRYAVFAPQNFQNLPIFIINKGIAMAVPLCFAIAFWQQLRMRDGITGTHAPTAWFRAGVWGICAHIPMSLSLLRPGYFPEFFSAERFSFNGEAVLLFGALTAGGVYLLTRTHWNALVRWRLSMLTMTALFAHTLFMGIARGINIKASHGYLPPMWMLSLIGIGLAVAFVVRSRPQPAVGLSPVP
jgi:hypothetical protein